MTFLGAACVLSCHSEDDHHDVHHHPAAADGDHPNQVHLQEGQGLLGGKSSSQVQATIYGGAVTVPPKPTSIRTLCWKIFTSDLRGLRFSQNCLGPPFLSVGGLLSTGATLSSLFSVFVAPSSGDFCQHLQVTAQTVASGKGVAAW